MNLCANHTNLPLIPCRDGTLLSLRRKTSFRAGGFRVYQKKRRRLKVSRGIAVVKSSLFPSHLEFDSLAPAIVGVTSGLAVYLSSRFLDKSRENRAVKSSGEWLLFTSPSPFNRFVLLRCPSISFDGEGLDERLVEEERHFVRLDVGTIPTAMENCSEDGGKLKYQRICVSTEDGGVISLDWPESLALEEERGLDTTVVLVPGTPEGSMEPRVKSFVYEALRRGLFPVVMNPRGCAGSPLTTPRLFTAADSDDISTAIQFISKARPWTTLMAVGWGYGANMLTKYLAEVGEGTPLTAATCIDNPFDLEEATTSSPQCVALDQQLMDGLVDILRSNMELFQGKTKGFDVEKGLSSKSVRDFEKAISMVTYGFADIEDFYSKSSTRRMIGSVKIPVLFIQNDEGIVPLFSIPRGSIAENPFTSLLLCSSPSNLLSGGRALLSWCQSLTIEWLTAVELGLLKGRHPLLKDIDISVNPSKGLALVEGKIYGKGSKVKKLVDLTHTYALGSSSSDQIKEIPKNSDATTNYQLRAERESEENIEDDSHELREKGNGAALERQSVEAELVQADESDGEDSERGQILQTAQVVMNMLDVTIPGTLNAEEKKKVLAAVDQGETLVKALQDAVPEDVREKLSSAVSGVLHTHGTKMKLDRVRFHSENHEQARGPSNGQVLHKDPHLSNQTKNYDASADGYDTILGGVQKPADQGLEFHPPETSQSSGDTDKNRMRRSNQDDSATEKGIDESLINHESNELEEKTSPSSDSGERNSEPGVNASENSSKASESGLKGLGTALKAGIDSQEKTVGKEDVTGDENKTGQDVQMSQQERKEDNNHKNEEKTPDSMANQNKIASKNMEENAISSPGSASDTQATVKEGNDSDDEMKENKNSQPAVNDQSQSAAPESSPSTFSVSQALDALTGIDDSTQVAVNSVFGVIENMISHFEETNIQDKKAKDETTGNGENVEFASENGCTDDLCANSMAPVDDMRNGHVKEDVTVSRNSVDGSYCNREVGDLNMEQKKDYHLLGGRIQGGSPVILNNVAYYKAAKPYENSLQNELFRGYLLSNSPSTERLDLDMTTALLLDYYPEEGQWKLLEQSGSYQDCGNTTNIDDRDVKAHSSAKDNFIEPAYVVFDAEESQEPVEEYDASDNEKEHENGSEELVHVVEDIVWDSLKVEVNRRLSSSDVKEMKTYLDGDIKKVANAVSCAAGCDVAHVSFFEGKNCNVDWNTEKAGILCGETIIKAMSSAIQDTRYLRRILPVGVIVGSSLAALRKYFHVSTIHAKGWRDSRAIKQPHMSGKKAESAGMTDKRNHNGSLNNSRIKKQVEAEEKTNNDGVMVGAVTAALGASALLVQQQDPQKGRENTVNTSKSREKGIQNKEPDKFDEERNNDNIVSSLAEKAMSVAGPVVPTKEGGEVDQDRLVSMLADLGQKGGMLRLVGKIALLWGGLRGAMSLTDRLILFLRIAERPLWHRVICFGSMVLVLWTPVVVPLLPTLVQSWSTSQRSRIAELVCIAGLYTAVLILITLWGKRIRGYANPLQQYGLDLTSSPRKKIQDFLKGLAGGITFVLLIQYVNVLFGCASFSYPLNLPSPNVAALLRGYGGLLLRTIRGTITATIVVLVEELLFRAWLPDEIAAELGYAKGIIISGLAFSLFQRSLRAVPGLWLLSFALAGARQRGQGSLLIPVGLRTGIMASSFIFQTGRFLTYNPGFPVWLSGTHPLQPLSGVVGLGFSLLLAIILYPIKQTETKKIRKAV